MENNYLLIAKSLLYLKNSKNYNVIKKGFFKNKPEISGFLINLTSTVKFKLFIIINTDVAEKNSVKIIEDNIFITYNKKIESLEKLIKNLNVFATDFVKLLEEAINKQGDLPSGSKEKQLLKYDLPYGYSRIENDNIIIDKVEAAAALNIFRTYVRINSIRKTTVIIRNSGAVARSGEKMGVGVISGILHDKRYLEMDKKVIPNSIFYTAQEILKRNSKKENIIRKF